MGLVGALSGGCGTATSPSGSPTPVSTDSTGSTVSYGWFAYGGPEATDAAGEPLGTPVDAVERSGLRLPNGADVRLVGSHSPAGSGESYLFVFRVSAAVASDFCEQDALGGARSVGTIPRAPAESMGNPRVTSGSRWCSGQSPKDAQWSRYVLIDAGDPATVHLLVQRAV